MGAPSYALMVLMKSQPSSPMQMCSRPKGHNGTAAIVEVMDVKV